MEEESLYDYATNVHQVLLQPNLLLGIGMTPAMIIILFTIIMANISLYACALGIVLYAIAKRICKKDKYMLSIMIERLVEPNIWRAD